MPKIPKYLLYHCDLKSQVYSPTHLKLRQSVQQNLPARLTLRCTKRPNLMTTRPHVEGIWSLTEQHMAQGCESLRTATLKIKHVAVMMEVGARGRIGNEIRFNCLDRFFFFFPPLLNKHQTAIRLVWQYHFLDFDNRRVPAASPPFTAKERNRGEWERVEGGGGENRVHNYHSKPCFFFFLNSQTSDAAERERALLGAHETNAL